MLEAHPELVEHPTQPNNGHVEHLSPFLAAEQFDELTQEEHEALAKLAISEQREFLMETAKAVRRKCGLKSVSSIKIAGILALHWWMNGEYPLSKRYRDCCCEQGENEMLRNELKGDLRTELNRFPRNRRARVNLLAQYMGYKPENNKGKSMCSGSFRNFVAEQLDEIISLLEKEGIQAKVESMRKDTNGKVARVSL